MYDVIQPTSLPYLILDILSQAHGGGVSRDSRGKQDDILSGRLQMKCCLVDCDDISSETINYLW